MARDWRVTYDGTSEVVFMAQTEVLDAPPSINPAFNKSPIQETIPELEAGDPLTRREFHRRYEAMPNLKKAELIEGVVYKSSPGRRKHGKYTSRINAWLSFYNFATQGTEVAANTTTILDEDNEPQLDVYLRIEEDYDGQSWPDEMITSRVRQNSWWRLPPAVPRMICTKRKPFTVATASKNTSCGA
jgi:Putative restriction endonuclease